MVLKNHNAYTINYTYIHIKIFHTMKKQKLIKNHIIGLDLDIGNINLGLT